jgi:transposase InsO family protein
MPWEQVSLVKTKLQLVKLVQSGAMTMSAACAQYGVTRKTGHKWLARYEAEGESGLEEVSRAPKCSPQAWPEETREAVLQLKQRRPHWGPKKLVAVLEREGIETPAISTAGEWLREAGLVKPRRRSAPRAKPTRLTQATKPNDVWCYDFKGQFRMGNGQYCYPLTVTDDASRMLLGCFALAAPTAGATKPCVEALFREYGLPQVLRSDNGEPFASVGLAGLTTLNVAWLKQGIRLERIRPASPQENGRHERMHRTLKDETTRPPKHFMAAQQRRFDEWRIDFNTQRPHEALGQAVPASRYSASTTSFRETATYPGHYEVRRVGNRGYIKLLGNSVHLSEALVGEDVGLVEVDDGLWRVLFLSDVICAIDLRGPTSRLIRDSSDD